MTCPRCGGAIPAGAKFCPLCGLRLGRFCPNCGAEAEPTHAFCLNCGTALDTGEPPEVGRLGAAAGTPASGFGAAGGTAGGAVAARAAAAPVLAERRLVSILFADLV